ncbi:MAG: GDSL-type esterase/lipase family protein [Candidatus Acidiferrales bacterium]
MAHIVLLGDSIFDNGAYTEGGPDVITQVRQLLPGGWHASLLAVDGATTVDVPSQVHRVPQDATRLVLSAGGNDALLNVGILERPVSSMAQAVAALADVSQEFEEKYRRAVSACRKLRLPLTLSTIYNGCFPNADYQRLASTALMVFNDVILRVGIEFGLSIIDLRFVCSSPNDYANPIEPSSIGGAKIARSIVTLATEEQIASVGACVVTT